MFLAGYTVAMVTYYVMKMITICSPIIKECFDTMIVALSDKEWLQWPIEILVLKTVLSHLKSKWPKKGLNTSTVHAWVAYACMSIAV